jgi:hypothetical protein
LNLNLEKILSHLGVSVRACLNSCQIILGEKTLELRPSGIDKSSSARAILGDYGVNTGTISGSAENPQKRDSTASIRSKKSIERYQLLPETGIDFILLRRLLLKKINYVFSL